MRPTSRHMEIAEQVTQSFFDSEELAEKFGKVINETKASPMTVIFAVLVMDEIKTQTDPKWIDMKAFVMKAFNAMKEEGIIGKDWKQDESN